MDNTRSYDLCLYGHRFTSHPWASQNERYPWVVDLQEWIILGAMISWQEWIVSSYS